MQTTLWTELKAPFIEQPLQANADNPISAVLAVWRFVALVIGLGIWLVCLAGAAVVWVLQQIGAKLVGKMVLSPPTSRRWYPDRIHGTYNPRYEEIEEINDEISVEMPEQQVTVQFQETVGSLISEDLKEILFKIVDEFPSASPMESAISENGTMVWQAWLPSNENPRSPLHFQEGDIAQIQYTLQGTNLTLAGHLIVIREVKWHTVSGTRYGRKSPLGGLRILFETPWNCIPQYLPRNNRNIKFIL